MTMSYKPANSTEGMIFEAAWCEKCACDSPGDDMEGPVCPILGNAYAGGQPTQWLQDENGPRCTAFVADTGQGHVDALEAERDLARYNALPRCPTTWRPIIT